MWLTVKEGAASGSTFPLDAGTVVIGRDASATIRLDDDQVSRRHAQVVVSDGRAELSDLGSTNGTFVDGHRLTSPVVLRAGQQVKIGKHVLVVGAPAAPAGPAGSATVVGGVASTPAGPAAAPPPQPVGAAARQVPAAQAGARPALAPAPPPGPRAGIEALAPPPSDPETLRHVGIVLLWIGWVVLLLVMVAVTGAITGN